MKLKPFFLVWQVLSFRLKKWNQTQSSKENCGQSNNFCLNWSFFVIKQNDMNQSFQKFTCKPQLAYYVCSFALMTSLTSRQFHHSKLRNFISSWKMVKNTIKLCRKFILRKINKNIKSFVHSQYDVTCIKFKTL